MARPSSRAAARWDKIGVLDNRSDRDKTTSILTFMLRAGYLEGAMTENEDRFVRILALVGIAAVFGIAVTLAYLAWK
jgi:hypothetical protein